MRSFPREVLASIIGGLIVFLAYANNPVPPWADGWSFSDWAEAIFASIGLIIMLAGVVYSWRARAWTTSIIFLLAVVQLSISEYGLRLTSDYEFNRELSNYIVITVLIIILGMTSIWYLLSPTLSSPELSLSWRFPVAVFVLCLAAIYALIPDRVVECTPWLHEGFIRDCPKWYWELWR